MNKDKKVSDNFSDDYKELPLKMRVWINKAATELLELQKANKAFLEEAGELGLDDGGSGNRG